MKMMKKKENNLRKIVVILIPIIIVAATGFLYFKTAGTKAKIGVININGEIRGFGYAELAERARDDSKIKAVVLRINSGGGTVTGTFQGEKSVSKLSKEKPVIANLEETAASGAYVIASAADNIFAYEHTITAGLGVIAIWISYENYLKKKGIKYHVWKTGKQKDMFSPWRGPTKKENAQIKSLVENFENELFNRIIKNRPRTAGSINAVKDGSTVYGKTALRLGLIDNIGSHEDAVEKATMLADLEEGEYEKVNLSEFYKTES